MNRTIVNSLFTVLLIILLVVSILSLSACCNEGEELTQSDGSNSAVCVLMGTTRNVCVPNYESIEDEVTQMAIDVTQCSLIVIDEDPDAVEFSSEIKYPEAYFFNKEEKSIEYIDQVMGEFVRNVPSSEEIDILSALNNAKKVLSKYACDNKRIIIYSSGISTSGELDFAKDPDLLNEDPEAIVATLKRTNSIPDLSGISLTWYGFGVVEAPQKPLSNSEENKLKAIWNAILRESKAFGENDSVQMDINMSGSYDPKEIKDNYPYVSVALFDINIEPIVLGPEQVEFIEEKAILVDENQAKEVLKPYIKLLKESAYKKFYLIGSTASDGDEAGCKELSIDRANVVKDLLTELGVPESKLEIYGLGRTKLVGNLGYTWRENDLDINGHLIKELAQRNRKVVIVAEDSDIGREFKALWKENK